MEPLRDGLRFDNLLRRLNLKEQAAYSALDRHLGG